MGYVATLAAVIVAYGCGLVWLRRLTNAWFWDLVFSMTVFSLYAVNVILVYYSVGINDWNFINALPTANVSPFTFTCVGLSVFFPRMIKHRFLTLLSLLSTGMAIACVAECIFYATKQYTMHVGIVFDIVAHAMLSLYGVYLVQSRQVKLDASNVFLSGSLVVGTALCMLIFNAIFRTTFFGLSLYGEHNIYGNVLTNDSAESAGLYFIGLCCVLLLGYFYQSILNGKKEELHVL